MSNCGGECSCACGSMSSSVSVSFSVRVSSMCECVRMIGVVSAVVEGVFLLLVSQVYEVFPRGSITYGI